MKPRPEFEAYARHVNPAFVDLVETLGYGRSFVRAKGNEVWDSEGKRYLDLLAGFGSVNVGHNHPRLAQAAQKLFASEPLHFNHVGPSQASAALAQKLAGFLPESLGLTLFSSSGSEAVEAAMKLACAATAKRGFLFCDGAYHGTGWGSLSLMGSSRMRKPFEPLLEHCHAIPFNDLAALERELKKGDVAAFVVEPLQCEGGLVFAKPGYLAEAQRLCRKYGALLALDEVQSGLGRCGSLFAFETEGFVPDVLILAKSLGGGVAAIGATCTSSELFKRAYGSAERFDLHSSTFAGNALSCALACETLDIVKDEGLVEQSRLQGAKFLAALQARLKGHALVADIRGKGLLIGISFGPAGPGLLNQWLPGAVTWLAQKAFGQWVSLKLLEAGFICQPASQRWDVLRIEPPLAFSDAEIAASVEAIGAVMDSYPQMLPAVKDLAQRLITRALPR